MGDNILNYSFEDLEINDELLRGIFAYGFEHPSNIQYKSIPIIKKTGLKSLIINKKFSS